KRPRSASHHHRARVGTTRTRQGARARLLPLTTEKMMLTNPTTIETLKSLKLHDLLETLEEQQQTPAVQSLLVREAHRAAHRSRAAVAGERAPARAAAWRAAEGQPSEHWVPDCRSCGICARCTTHRA